ncbi:MAG: hypothetical protein ACP5N2_00615 [Candidatus Nanoarchaeia archaeon]
MKNLTQIAEQQIISPEKAKQIAQEICRLQYDLTSNAFQKVYELMLDHKAQELNKKSNYELIAKNVLLAKTKIDEAWKNSKNHMVECVGKHPRNIEGYETVEDAVVEIYNAGHIGYFIGSAINELMSQSEKDSAINHPKLAKCLLHSAYRLDEALDELSQNY